MKTSKIYNILVASALLVCSCSDDLGVQSENLPVADAGQTVHIGASLESGGSRLAYNESDAKVTLTWEEDDVLKVFNPSQESSVTNFTLEEGTGLAYGVFEGTPTTAYSNGDVLHALYHKGMADTDIDSEGNVNISLATQDGTLKEDYQLMYGSATYTSGNVLPAIKLKHLTSVLKVTIPTDKTLKKLVLTDGGRWSDNLRSKATLLVKKVPSSASAYKYELGDLAYNSANENPGINNQVVVEGTFAPDENGEVVIYVYVLFVKRYDGNNIGDGNSLMDPSEPYMTPSFIVTDENDVEYVGTTRFSDKVVEAGKMYSLSTKIFNLKDFASGTGQGADPYVINNAEQLYSFMLRCTSKEDYNNPQYAYSCYKLGADIELDGSVPWTPFDFHGIFDGDGHKITGEMGNMMFNDLRDATVKNLTLELEPFEYTGYFDMGRLAKLASNSNIINCVNNSDITAMEDYGGSAEIFGGLVAILENNSKMIGCVNTGNITAKSQKMLGGLVGVMRFGAIMEACYSSGNLTVAYEYQYQTVYLGGLVGSINFSDYTSEEYGDARMTSCWNNMVITVDERINDYQMGDIVGSGTENTDYFTCYKVESTPSSDQVSTMNGALETVGSTYRFGDSGNPYKPQEE